jgi:hypothetical protein
VTVVVGGKRGFGIVEMQAQQVLESDGSVPLLPDLIPSIHDVVSRGVQMAGVGTESHTVPQGLWQTLSKRRQLFEPRSQGRAAPRCCLDEYGRAAYTREAATIASGVASETGLAIIDEVAGMSHHIGNGQRAAPFQFADEAFLGFLPKRGVR